MDVTLQEKLKYCELLQTKLQLRTDLYVICICNYHSMLWGLSLHGWVQEMRHVKQLHTGLSCLNCCLCVTVERLTSSWFNMQLHLTTSTDSAYSVQCWCATGSCVNDNLLNTNKSKVITLGWVLDNLLNTNKSEYCIVLYCTGMNMHIWQTTSTLSPTPWMKKWLIHKDLPYWLARYCAKFCIYTSNCESMHTRQTDGNPVLYTKFMF